MDDAAGDRAAIEIGLALGSKRDLAVFECEKSVVLADTDIAASHDGSTALTDDYLACTYGLTIGELDPEILRI